MKNRILCLLALAALLLSGCTPMLERSYASVTPHQQFSDETKDASILRAETYQGLVSALLHLIGQGETTGVVRLYQYVSVSGSAASDVDQACLEVSKEDPLGAYAVDYIKYDVAQTAAYYEVNVKLAYTKTPEQIAKVISVTASSAIAQELGELLPDQPTEAVFRISYFTKDDNADTIRQAVQEAYAPLSDTLPALEDIQVSLYPDQGPQRVAEIKLTWNQADFKESWNMENFLGNLEN